MTSNPAAMTERLIDDAIYAETASGPYVSAARKEVNDARADIEAALEERDRLKVERDEARALLSAADKGHPIESAVERVLDEHSAWIARPSQDVTRAVALAAGIAWMYAPIFGANDRANAAEARALASESRVSALREALASALAWHESEDKALSKSGRSDADYHWRRLQHREQLDQLRAALPEAEYDAAWDRINARALSQEALDA